MTPVARQRITLKRKSPNRLFQDWLEELHGDAKKSGSKLEPMLKEALDSIAKYPLHLSTGAECLILKGFNKKLCMYLDKLLEKYRSSNELELSQNTDSENRNVASPCEENSNRNLRNHHLKTSKNVVCSMNSDMPSSANNNRQLKNKYSKTSADVEFVEDLDVPSSSKINRKHSNKYTKTSEHDNLEVNLDLPSSGGNNSNLQYEYPETSENVVCLLNIHKNLDVASSASTNSNNSQPTDITKKNFTGRVYKPAHRSGGYALLIALLEYTHENPNNCGLAKESLIELAQKHSEESFVRPKAETFYTAWSNMSRLVTKGYVKKTRNKKVFYSLTDLGTSIATQLLKESSAIPSINDVIFNDNLKTNLPGNRETEMEDREILPSQSTGSQSSSADSDRIIEMTSGSFEIILLIDKNETSGVTKKTDPTVAQFNKYPDLKHEYRSLKVGDFAWIARQADTDEELVLPYIVERKRMDDLGASIKDGRFHEQKFRLRKCGLSNVIYLVENYGNNVHVGLPLQSLMQALANTRVQDDFKIHMTNSLSHSARFLAMMTKRLTAEYEEQTLIGCNKESTGGLMMTFKYFNKSSTKTKPLTVTETFIKLLLQLKGVSIEKALAITNEYSTPFDLIRAYDDCNNQKEKEFLLSNLKYGDNSRNVGHIISKSLYHLFS